MSVIWIVAENPDWAAVLVSAAKSVSADAKITVFTPSLPADGLWEDYTPALVAKAKAEKPSLILLGTSRRGRDLAARSAALLDAPCFSDAKNLALNGNAFTCDTNVYGGTAVRTDSTTEPLVLATIGPKTFEPDPAGVAGASVGTLEYSPGRTKVTGRKPRPPQTVNLGEATKVVAVGRGFSEEKDLAAAKELAAALGAEVACSRPIAEFFKWLPEECYIGISGQIIKPQLYVAVGISGQAQHTFGIRDAKVIVSVNKDAECLMHQHADYCITGEWQMVIPALIKAVKA
ncbi:MAG: electron transfer flavoprotein subunit alpha/FixB family protein [Desulfovibrio sp.]|jgi:electron transfer flavoprotein alpha subunit|nr:electron transfer flavoprotein subunit alpha/FixB family protein [Desulfovibrio sp.]